MPELDLTGQDWENKFIPNVLGGLVLNQNSESMQGNEFLTCDGLIYRDGDIIKDTGYSTFGDIPGGAPGIFRRVFKHITAAGVANTFGISNLGFYVLANSGANWHGIQLASGGNTTIDANISGTDTVIPVAVTTNFAVNDTIALRLDDGSDHISTIASVSAGVSITIDDALAGAGVVATSGNACIEILTLAGTSDKHVFALTIPWNDALAFTNGIDPPQYYDPSTTEVQIIPNLPSAGDTICESLALFDSSLILVRTTEGGTRKNQRLRWSDKADFTEWVTGDAGFIDLLDSEDKVNQALPIGPYLAVYRDKKIYRGTAVNSAVKRFQWDPVVTKQGIMSSAGVVDIGDRHFVVGNKQTYLYQGGFSIEPIGDSIKKLIYGPEAEIDISAKGKAFVVYIEERNDVLVFYQTTGGTEPNKTLRWHGDLNTWITRSFDDQILGFGEATESNSFTWNDLIGNWEDQTWQWNSTAISGDIETVLFCSDDGQVHEYDFIIPDDNTIAKTYTIETPDFSHPNGRLRTDYIEFKGTGSSILVEVSIDEGVSWTSIETINLGTTPMKRRVFKQVSSRTIRYRLSGSQSFRLSWFNLRVTLETEN